ncbi:MAG: hypothetical protein LBE86_08540 [Gemmobacter sp.]|jgi:hypothetical protein|nr:hypothetical protein [Gemmobacter sp.]
MSNVVRFAAAARSSRVPAPQGGLAALLAAVATGRRREGDAFWLKENAELLGILAALRVVVPAEALVAYAPFHDSLPERMAFHPQYYRMLLGLAVALRDLGQPGDMAERLAASVAAGGWIDSEVNDLQRAESRYLLARSGQRIELPGLDDRLRGFMARPETFALPNPRAAYDLLHAIFYLSEYGRRPFSLDENARAALDNLGNLACLDGDGDLLAEVCIALRYCGEDLPALWQDMVVAEAQAFRVEPGYGADYSDSYHNYLVNQWLIGTIGITAFGDRFPAGPMTFKLIRSPVAPLREWSQALLTLGERRRADYAVMRAACAPRLSPAALAAADRAAEASPGFERFFATFARPAAASPGPVLLRRGA